MNTAITVNCDITLIQDIAEFDPPTCTADVIRYFLTKYPEIVCSQRLSADPGGPTMTLVIDDSE